MQEEKLKDGYYKIRPAGRHIITIGRDLIKDKYASIVELVKNAYDADSPSCKVSLLPFTKTVEIDNQEVIQRGIKIIVKDEGHGMTFETVTDKWMVPSTDDKLKRDISPKGRKMQGKKGIGRYSASMIGDDMVLQTIDEKGELTTLYLIWQNFEDAKYLEDVNVLIENFKTDRKNGTEIIIVGDEFHLNEWNEKQIQNLKFELKKLIPPVDNLEHKIDADTDNFKIQLELGDFPYDNYKNKTEDIEPYPLFELYDYRISGYVDNKGKANLKFYNSRTNDPNAEIIPEFNINLNTNTNRKGDEAFCGTLKVDFSVYDRDTDSIDNLIQRGLTDPITKKYVGRREARLILDSYNGVGVFRNGFRIRPLGDAGFDWLELDKERVQDPGKKIGSDQIIGFIHIESEDKSGLIEKSARDGLRDNAEYLGLQEICKKILSQLESRRFAYRLKVGLGRSQRGIEEKINSLYSFKDLKEGINKQLDAIGITDDRKEKINKLISEKEEKSNKIAEELKQIIALYQGQATVGKIINVIRHESSKPLGYFKQVIPLIRDWNNELKKEFNQETLDTIITRLTTIDEQVNIFVRLFEKLDPLSAKKRDKKKEFNLKGSIEKTRDVFLNELQLNNISLNIDCDETIKMYAWEEDIYIVLTNLIDNSIYWLKPFNRKDKSITIKVSIDDNTFIIDYTDNGPGIDKHLIESEIIFEPEFSNKTGGGSGLGLAISGEAIERNEGKLKAIYSDNGAFFKIEIPIQ